MKRIYLLTGLLLASCGSDSDESGGTPDNALYDFSGDWVIVESSGNAACSGNSEAIFLYPIDNGEFFFLDFSRERFSLSMTQQRSSLSGDVEIILDSDVFTSIAGHVDEDVINIAAEYTEGEITLEKSYEATYDSFGRSSGTGHWRWYNNDGDACEMETEIELQCHDGACGAAI